MRITTQQRIELHYAIQTSNVSFIGIDCFFVLSTKEFINSKRLKVGAFIINKIL